MAQYDGIYAIITTLNSLWRETLLWNCLIHALCTCNKTQDMFTYSGRNKMATILKFIFLVIYIYIKSPVLRGHNNSILRRRQV